ncbi:pseudouridine-5'-phosphate glycosidase [Euzebya tangerina]|uniref:pseudouridine-5'-phosphate glycosidase n=1 Tax=Euzebya tangerina TaxID=591198 RepID=UPI000E31F1A0|nr:pseudouridine-5'-phosphate glycosidase [Euzebya tangerina]
MSDPLSSGAVIVHDEVQQALHDGVGVVALESTLIAHGLPRGQNLDVAEQLEKIVRNTGAVPATIAVIDGKPHIGLDGSSLARIAQEDDVAKLSIRDLGPAMATRRTGATTVASTSHLAAVAGIKVFATGGLGGVHREARDSWDESADLAALARTPMIVVCAGVKSILDVSATLERLESHGVPVLGYQTSQFPGFYLRSSGQPIDWTVSSTEQVAEVHTAMGHLGLGDRAIVLANPIAAKDQLDPTLHDRVLHSGLALLTSRRITGKDVTPFLLDHFHTSTGGESLRVNIRVVEGNAALAAEVAVQVASS